MVCLVVSNKTILKNRIGILLLILCIFITGCNSKKSDVSSKMENGEIFKEDVQYVVESCVAEKEFSHSVTERDITENENIQNSKVTHADLSTSIDYEYIEKEHKILEYNICTAPNYDYSNTVLDEYLKEDVEDDKEMCNKMDIEVPLEIEYFLFDFNADGLEDYLVCMNGWLWGGSGGNTARIYVQESNGTLRRILDITLRLHEPYLPDGHAPMAVLDEMTDGYYGIVLPGSNRIMRYDMAEERYVFQDDE